MKYAIYEQSDKNLASQLSDRRNTSNNRQMNSGSQSRHRSPRNSGRFRPTSVDNRQYINIYNGGQFEGRSPAPVTIYNIYLNSDSRGSIGGEEMGRNRTGQRRERRPSYSSCRGVSEENVKVSSVKYTNNYTVFSIRRQDNNSVYSMESSRDDPRPGAMVDWASIRSGDEERYDLQAEIDKLRPYQEYTMPSHDVHIDVLHLRMPVHIVGNKDYTVYVNRSIIVSHIEAYDSYGIESLGLRNVFAPLTHTKNNIDIVVNRNRVILSNMNIEYSNASRDKMYPSIIKLTGDACLQVTGCSISYTQRDDIFHTSPYDHLVYFLSCEEGLPTTASIESTIMRGMDGLYSSDVYNDHSIYIDRCQIYESRGTIVRCSYRHKIVIMNTTHNSNDGVCLQVHDNLLPSQTSPTAKSFNMRFTPFNIQSYIHLFNNTYSNNSESVITIHADLHRIDMRSTLFIRSCVFSNNLKSCILAISNNKCMLHVIDNKFVSNSSDCIFVQRSSIVHVSQCKFESNKMHALSIADTSFVFEENRLYNNNNSLYIESSGESRTVSTCKVIRNRLEGAKEKGIEVYCRSYVNIIIHTNIIVNNSVGVYFTSSFRGGTHRSIVDMFDNDIIDNREYGVYAYGCNVLLNLKKDILKNNAVGCIYYHMLDGSYDGLVIDTETPPILDNDVYINGVKDNNHPAIPSVCRANTQCVLI